MSEQPILTETRGAVGIITINRPKTLNALDIPTVQALDKAFGAMEADAAVRVIVVTRKMQAHDQALFRHIGVEPAEQRLVAVKSSVHFRADFQPIAERVLVIAAPGPVVADPSGLPFTNLRPGLRLRPGDNCRTG